ncbi:MAG: hypothetical protein JXQ80_12835 [Bacteroidales bacterium]|nr:hypothetical protein [Bacteroidales bacterium]
MTAFLSGCEKPFVRLTDENAQYGDLEGHLKIETSQATYYFNKSGGGFSGIVDLDGNDWVGHSEAPKASGMWRGLPNTNIPGWRPEQSGTETKIVVNESDRLTITCEKNNYKCNWTFYPDRAMMTIIAADSNYYFSYEGAPNGKFEPSTSYLFRPDLAKRHFLGQPTDETDIRALPSEDWEWCFFGDLNTKRSFFLVHHEDDSIPDYYRPMEGMTVFGFGRTGKADENLTHVPQSFTIGFCEDTAYQVVSSRIRTIAKNFERVE